jgi:23S rRNA (cytidine1920-2'-O)/16S rRNA (cytidine1409-2'-O)-methyltransferase
VPRLLRLDAALVKRGLARSREQAVDAIAAGRVTVGGLPAHKASTAVAPDAVLAVASGDEEDWASRGAYKLLGALDVWEAAQPPLQVAGKRCLDAGASTGGFTDVLLRRDAREVVAVDVGYGQLRWRLQTDPRVVVHDRTNVRSLTPDDIGGPVDLVVADLSFISLPLVLPALTACTTEDGELVLLVKPQFEVGREAVGAGGVVRDPQLRAGAIRGVADRASEVGFGVRGVVASPLPGPAGNVEYLLWLARDAAPLREDDLLAAIEQGPQ